MAAIALVQNATGLYGGNSTSHSIPLNGVTRGNCLVLPVMSYHSGGGSNLSISDGVNSWVRACKSVLMTNALYAEIWYALNVAAGNITVTISDSINDYVSAGLSEFSGVATNAALDQTNTNTGLSVNPTAGSVTTSTAGELYIAVIGGFNERTYTAPSGWNDRFNNGSSSNQPIDYASYGDTSVVAAGTYNPTWTLNNSDNFAAAVATFLPAAGGGGGGSTSFFFGGVGSVGFWAA